jgi:hypothetical protein
MRPTGSQFLYGSQARKYRSKRQRPCDLCRQRKTQCKIQGPGGACELCDKLGRNCTFVLQPLRKERGLPESRPISAQHQPSHPPETQPTVQYRGSQSHLDARQGGPMPIDVSAFENEELEFGINVNSETLPPVSDQLSFSGQGPPDSQGGGAIDWSYLNFPICKKLTILQMFMTD